MDAVVVSDVPAHVYDVLCSRRALAQRVRQDIVDLADVDDVRPIQDDDVRAVHSEGGDDSVCQRLDLMTGLTLDESMGSISVDSTSSSRVARPPWSISFTRSDGGAFTSPAAARRAFSPGPAAPAWA